LRIVDLRAAARVARRAGVPVAVDATFASPALLRPIELGVDYVVHSATKYLGGHGDLTGSVVAGGKEAIRQVAARRRLLGGILDPFAAFLLHRGVGTLAVRMEAHSRTALQIATGLLENEQVEQVSYPGLTSHPDHALAKEQMNDFGGMVTFTVRGGKVAAERVHDSLRLFAHAGSLGAIRSLASLPARMSHRYVDAATREAIGVPENMIRLSVGLESSEDLMADLTRALRGRL
jgi:cystathionine beta-lyase/cystathionine gamma-synthase